MESGLSPETWDSQRTCQKNIISTSQHGSHECWRFGIIFNIREISHSCAFQLVRRYCAYHIISLQTMRRYECDMSPFLSCSFCFPSISLYVVFKSFLSVNCSFHQGQLDPPKRSETTLKPLWNHWSSTRAELLYFPVLLPSTTVYYKACTNHFPVLLCTTKLAQSTSQYYCVLQSLHKALPSTTVYYKACTNHFPVLLCTTKLAQRYVGVFNSVKLEL